MNDKNLKKVPHDCVLQLQAVYRDLKSAEKKAADLILETPESIPDLTIVEFAAAACCSVATIVRLSKRLGYDGYPELRKAFKNRQSDDDFFEYDNLTRGDDPFTVFKKVSESSIIALRDTISILCPKEYGKAVEAVRKANAIMFCGVGDAGAVALEAYQKYVRIGKKGLFSQDSDLNLILASQLTVHDVIVAISHSGKSKIVVDTVKIAKANKAAVIAITNFPISPLTKNADIVLQTAVFSKTMTGEIMAKRVTALCIIESLYLNDLIKNEKDYLPFLKISNQIVKLYKI